MPFLSQRKAGTGFAGSKGAQAGYAESCARSSVKSKYKRGGAASVVESSAWGGSDDTGNESVSGNVDDSYIAALRRTTKRNKGALALPQQWLPDAHWEPVKSVHAGAVPVARVGHGIAIVAPPCTTTHTSDVIAPVLDHLCIIGGRASSVSLYGPPRSPLSKAARERDKALYKRQQQHHQQHPQHHPQQQQHHHHHPPQHPQQHPHQQQQQHHHHHHHQLDQQQHQQQLVRTPRSDQGLVSFRLRPNLNTQHDLRAEWHAALAPSPPRQLMGSTVCALAGGTCVAVFGGLVLDTEQVCNDLFVLDVARGSWRDESAAEGGPPPCIDHAAVGIDAGRSMLVHGGTAQEDDSSMPLGSIRRLDVGRGTVEWHEVKPQLGSRLECLKDSSLTQAPLRRAHTLCARGGADGVACAYIFGGYDETGEVCASLTVLDLERCLFFTVDAAGTPPVARAHHTAVRLGPYMAVFGGINAMGIAIAELRLLHLPTMMWTTPDVKAAPSNGPGFGVDERSEDKTDSRDSSPALQRSAAGSSFRMSSSDSRGGRRRGQSPTQQLPDLEPPARSQHSAVALTSSRKPGECAMLIFGGKAGETCKSDMFRLVLQLPKEREPGCAVRSHPDKAYQFVMENLEEAMKDTQNGHVEQMEDGAQRQKDILAEARNLETRSLAVEQQISKYQGVRAKSKDQEDLLRKQMEQEERKILEKQRETRAKLRELEMEAESLLAKAHRMESEEHADFEGMLPVEDIDMNGSTPVSKTSNSLVPAGFIDRRDVRWRGSRATVEVFGFLPSTTLGSRRHSWGTPNSRPCSRASISTAPSPPSSRPRSRMNLSRSPSPPGSPPGASAKRGTDAGIFGAVSASGAFGLMDSQRDGSQELLLPAASTAEVAVWKEAARNELRVVAMLRHPNLQEIYGAAVDAAHVYLLTEPFLETLANRLNRSEGNSSSSLGGVGRNVPVPARGNSAALGDGPKLHISCDLAGALEYLHAKGVAHRHVVLENIFIRDQGEAGPLAKLGGHYMARTSCRALGEPYVPIQALVQEVAKVKGDKPLRRMNAFDARSLDVRALGVVFLKLWLHRDTGQWKNLVFLDGQADNTEDIDAAVEAKRRVAHLARGEASLASEIRDPSLRLIVSACLGTSSQARPSAGVLRRALCAVQEGDVTELPALVQDASKDSSLADMAVDPPDDEARLGAAGATS
mmetsp:Transcript_61588/g.159881  ORF Transcript_61588/g.159881 Transcript_61588/m.159881 type:complete len:1191 (-) Transcript_61588:95-3667(-)